MVYTTLEKITKYLSNFVAVAVVDRVEFEWWFKENRLIKSFEKSSGCV